MLSDMIRYECRAFAHSPARLVPSLSPKSPKKRRPDILDMHSGRCQGPMITRGLRKTLGNDRAGKTGIWTCQDEQVRHSKGHPLVVDYLGWVGFLNRSKDKVEDLERNKRPNTFDWLVGLDR